jgi:tetratricopeptide (TPR) repeat protein
MSIFAGIQNDRVAKLAWGMRFWTVFEGKNRFLCPILGLSSRPGKGCMQAGMKIRKIGVIAVLVFSSFAASNVAPSKSELEAMYDKAFREFDANNFSEALKDLDAIDARQPDLAESQNLRGVILMRQGIYDKAETALMEALRIDPKFWNARFNLAEIPFLKKDWAEARKRFQDLLSSNAAELQGDASQLIQYKILLTYLLEDKENMVDSILAKFELSPDTPAVHYANAAIALQHKNTKEAKDWMVAAEKNFSPQLNKLFVESLYEVGWLEKPAGQARPALELTSAAERTAKSKAFARSRFEEAQKALQQRDLTAARKFIDDADAADPNQPVILNMRGEVLMEQREFDQAEAAFKAAVKADPKFREAQYNLAQVPFKKKDYTQARSRFEALFSQTPGGDKNQAAQLIKFKIFMTLLLEDKESRAQKMMEQFQFTGDTPALYYAQAAWEFAHNNPTKGTDWIASARKIYSPALNVVFADTFYDLGWLESRATTATSATEAAAVMSSGQAESSSPAIEPSPIPAVAAAKGKPAKESSSEPLALAVATPAVAAIETTNPARAAGTPARPGDVPAAPAPTLSPTVETPVAADASPASTAIASVQQSPIVETTPASSPLVSSARTVASATPATAIAPSRVREWSQPTVGERLDRLADPQTLLVGALLIAGVILLASVVVPEVRRRIAQVALLRRPTPVTGLHIDEVASTSTEKPLSLGNRLVGGPRRVSLKLKASEPSLRYAVLPTGKLARPIGEAAPVDNWSTNTESEIATAAAEEPALESVGPIIEQDYMPLTPETKFSPAPELMSTPMPVATEPAPLDVVPPVYAQRSPVAEGEPVGQGQPIPHQTTVFPEPPAEITRPQPQPQPIFVPRPTISQPTTTATMPEPIQIPTAPAPLVRTPATSGPQPAGTMQTAVQLTFSFEIASMQLTPAFKMGALQLRPTSKVVTMRLAPSGSPQPAMNLQVNFEIAKIQPSGGGLGSVRLTPSQQQRPTVVGSPSFNVAGLQLVSNFEAAPLQITPAQTGQAGVLVTSSFQIATVEFSPSFEIASIVLNSISKNISVQLPGAPSPDAPTFEIGNLQIAGTGELGLMQVHAIGQGPRRT